MIKYYAENERKKFQGTMHLVFINLFEMNYAQHE